MTDIRTETELQAALPKGTYVHKFDAVGVEHGPGWYWASADNRTGTGPFQSRRAALLACIVGSLTP